MGFSTHIVIMAAAVLSLASMTPTGIPSAVSADSCNSFPP